jgi:hypothetical protein
VLEGITASLPLDHGKVEVAVIGVAILAGLPIGRLQPPVKARALGNASSKLGVAVEAELGG